jgi:hypothetical protein
MKQDRMSTAPTHRPHPLRAAVEPITAPAAARTASRLGDAPGVHPAAAAILNAIQDLGRYQPTDADDAAALLLSLGGDGTGTTNVVCEAIDLLGTIGRHPAITSQVTTAAALYVQAATDHLADQWQNGTTGEIANGEAIRIIRAPAQVPVPDFHAQFDLYDHNDD